MSGKNSIFRSPEGETHSYAAYDAVLAHWPVPYEEQDLLTQFGHTHIIASGPDGAKPVILMHGQDSSAASWIYNISDLSRAFRIYAVDTIGDMGKSKPARLPINREDYALWVLDVLDQLKLEKANLVGLSYPSQARITSASLIASTAWRVANPGCPGPTPTSLTMLMPSSPPGTR